MEHDWVAAFRATFGHVWLHVGFIGLAANLCFFLAYGSRLENRAGSIRFVLFLVSALVVSAGVFGWITSRWSNTSAPWSSDDLRVGGAVLTAPVLGAHLVRFPRAHILCVIPPLWARVPTVIAVLAWLIAQVHPLQCFIRLGDAEPVSFVQIGCAAVAGVGLVWLIRRRPGVAVEQPRRAKAKRARPKAGASAR